MASIPSIEDPPIPAHTPSIHPSTHPCTHTRQRDDDSDTDKKRRRKEEKEEKRLVKEARRYLEKEKKKEKKEKEDDGPPLRPIPEVLSAVDDYYRRQTEFRVWLRQVKNTSFEVTCRLLLDVVEKEGRERCSTMHHPSTHPTYPPTHPLHRCSPGTRPRSSSRSS